MNMKKYIVAYISFFDNVLTQEVVFAESEYNAILSKLSLDSDSTPSSVEELKQLAFDMDCMVSAIQI